jgi:hypothetical protein
MVDREPSDEDGNGQIAIAGMVVSRGTAPFPLQSEIGAWRSVVEGAA